MNGTGKRNSRVESFARRVAKEGQPGTLAYGCEGTPSSGPYVAEFPAITLRGKFQLVREWPHWLLVTPTTVDVLLPSSIAVRMAGERLSDPERRE